MADDHTGGDTGAHAVEILERAEGVQGDQVKFFRIDKIVSRSRAPGGEWAAALAWEIVERADSTAALIYDVEADEVVLARQFRAPMLNRLPGDGLSQAYLLETVAGIVADAETPEASIKRETLEETGYRLERLEKLALFYPSPGGSSERVHLFIGEVRASDRLSEGGGALQEGEAIEVVRMRPEELSAMVERGDIQDAKLLVAAPLLMRKLTRRVSAPGAETSCRLESGGRTTSFRLRLAPPDTALLRYEGAFLDPETATATDRVVRRVSAEGYGSAGRRGFRRYLKAAPTPPSRRRFSLTQHADRDPAERRASVEEIMSSAVKAASAALAGGDSLYEVEIGVETVGDYQMAVSWLQRAERLEWIGRARAHLDGTAVEER